MGIWQKPGQEDAQMLRELTQLANGYDRNGQPVSRETQIAAIQQYQQVQELKGRRAIEAARQASDAQLAAAQAAAVQKRAETEAEVERRRVSVEEKRLQLDAMQTAEKLRLESVTVLGNLQIGKADVLVRALQVAVDGGMDPDQLLLAIQGLGNRLLPGPEPLLQLTAVDEDDET
jgi:hypothetical protein